MNKALMKVPLVILATFLVGLAIPKPVPATGEAEDTSCGPVLRLPAGTLVQRSESGDGLVVTLPSGLSLTPAGHLVSVDPDTIYYLDPEELASVVVDCDCDGGSSGGCTEAYNPSTGNVFCDKYGGCNDCKMKITLLQ